MTMSLTVASVLSDARAGSRDALGQALNRCRRYLLEVALESLSPALLAKCGASDVVQDTFLEAQRQFPNFHGVSEAQFLAWLRCLLLHKVAKIGRRYCRTRKRQLSREITLDDEGAPTFRSGQIMAAEPTPSAVVMADEQTHRLHDAITRLPSDYRQVVMLRYKEGLSFEETGLRMGRSADAARMLWARAVVRLKLEMRGDRSDR
jgi:RNA polymerase sigma-70 factor (ECF subfamily)